MSEPLLDDLAEGATMVLIKENGRWVGRLSGALHGAVCSVSGDGKLPTDSVLNLLTAWDGLKRFDPDGDTSICEGG